MISQSHLKRAYSLLTHPPVFENMRHALPLTISAFNWHLRIQWHLLSNYYVPKAQKENSWQPNCSIRGSLRLFECLDWKMMYLSVGVEVGFVRRGAVLCPFITSSSVTWELHAACRCLTNMHWTHKRMKKKKENSKEHWNWTRNHDTEIGLEIMKCWETSGCGNETDVS